jgi:hypothetical protein
MRLCRVVGALSVKPNEVPVVGKDVKGKLSLLFYILATPLAFLPQLILDGLYVFVVPI